jgi:hypothetical protein
VAGRSSDDEEGRPYPILHLCLESARARATRRPCEDNISRDPADTHQA